MLQPNQHQPCARGRLKNFPEFFRHKLVIARIDLGKGLPKIR